jgi:DNA polymerase
MEMSVEKREQWYAAYRQTVINCSACAARRDCKQPVPGEGSMSPQVFFIGRNPGEKEDRIGRPFVGNAGEVFERFLMEIELERPNIFITNMCLCKTKKNRLLSKFEAGTCIRKFLIPSLKFMKPKIVVVFGAQPNYFINSIPKISECHGKVFKHKMGFHVVPSIHPAAVCYKPEKYKELQKIAQVIYEVQMRA